MHGISNPPPPVAKYITFTRDREAASGDVSYTGVGFRPTAVLFLATITGNLASIGMSDGTNHKLIKSLDTTAIQVLTTKAISCVTNANVGQSAVLASFGSDGFTLTWTKEGAPAAGTIVVMAVCFA